MHSTNYYNAFIEIAEDCPVSRGEVPPVKGDKKSISNMQFNMLYDNPYKYTSDEILFTVFASRRNISKGQWEEEKAQYFSKGQPCFRASPLTKRYGWGIHYDKDGKMAMYGAETQEYQKFLADDRIEKYKAMRSKRK